MTKRFEPCPLPSKNPTKSFWHSEPDEFLLGHRTTPQLPRHSDIVIVGTGLTGTSAARWLKELDTPLKSKNVLMLEAREACWGATGRVSTFLLHLCAHIDNSASIGPSIKCDGSGSITCAIDFSPKYSSVHFSYVFNDHFTTLERWPSTAAPIPKRTRHWAIRDKKLQRSNWLHQSELRTLRVANVTILPLHLVGIRLR